MSLATITNVPHFSTSFAILDEHNQPYDLKASQSIPGSNVDTTKLQSLLRMKFSAGSYDLM
jgi:hypothetical protein